MRFRLTLAETFLGRIHAELAGGHPVVTVPAGLRRAGELCELLVPAPHLPQSALPVRFFIQPPTKVRRTHLSWPPDPSALYAPRVDIALNPGRGCSAAVQLGGWCAEPLDEVRIPGARMERWVPGVLPAALDGAVARDGAFTRYHGALGGRETHERLRALRAFGAGMGRLNSLMATALVKAGVGTVAFADHDRVEPHNLDATETLAEGVLGLPKVDAVARFLRAVAPTGTSIRGIAERVDGPNAVAAALQSDLIFSAPDQDRARLIASLIAVSHHRVHLDLGVGVRTDPAGGFQAGADIRLVVPGDGCLLCLGGLDLHRPILADWRRARAGSLRSFNSAVAGQGMLLLERLVAGDVTRSVWLRLEVNAHGVVQTRELDAQDRRADCAMCERAGMGDAAWVA